VATDPERQWVVRHRRRSCTSRQTDRPARCALRADEHPSPYAAGADQTDHRRVATDHPASAGRRNAGCRYNRGPAMACPDAQTHRSHCSRSMAWWILSECPVASENAIPTTEPYEYSGRQAKAVNTTTEHVSRIAPSTGYSPAITTVRRNIQRWSCHRPDQILVCLRRQPARQFALPVEARVGSVSIGCPVGPAGSPDHPSPPVGLDPRPGWTAAGQPCSLDQPGPAPISQ